VLTGVTLVGSRALPVSAAVIELVNGRDIEARDYWREGPWFVFAHPRGTVGLPLDAVLRIVPTSRGARIESASQGVNALRCLSGVDRSVTLPPSMPSKDDLFDRAVDFVADGKLDEAIATYQEALAIDPEFGDAIQGLAMAYADKEMFDEAITWAKRLAELTPDDTLAHTSLSMFYQRKGMIAEAEAEGAKARMLDWKRQLAEQKKEGDGS
jgi:tetratricopeptide (TPR) repeat protein